MFASLAVATRDFRANHTSRGLLGWQRLFYRLGYVRLQRAQVRPEHLRCRQTNKRNQKRGETCIRTVANTQHETLRRSLCSRPEKGNTRSRAGGGVLILCGQRLEGFLALCSMMLPTRWGGGNIYLYSITEALKFSSSLLDASDGEVCISMIYGSGEAGRRGRGGLEGGPRGVACEFQPPSPPTPL